MKKEITLADVTVEVSCEPEHEPIKGNAIYSGDAEIDRKVESGIARQIMSGNEWAWCVVRVDVVYKGLLKTSDTLGCCSYESKEDFINSGYYQDMVDGCLSRLNRDLKALCSD